MKSNVIGNTIIVLLLISSCKSNREIIREEYFTTGIESKIDCISKHGNPDFIYKNEFKRECWAYYDSLKSVNSVCFNDDDKMATSSWVRDFQMPETTELIEKTEEWSYLKFYEKTFQLKELQNGDFHIYIIPSFFNETVITFNDNDSIGNFMTANGNIWSEISRLARENGNYDSIDVDDFKCTYGFKTRKINISNIVESLRINPVDSLGSIKKKGILISDGTSIHIKSKRNGKIYYSEFQVIPWYDERFETIKNEIITGYNIWYKIYGGQ